MNLSAPPILGSQVEIVTDRNKSLMLGIIAWLCIAVGLGIVLLVLFHSRKPGKKRKPNIGRRRYRSPKNKKRGRLLDEKYYRNLRK